MHFRSRVGYVDGLRAIAVLGVVASHSWPWFHYGQRGVDLFFVLSGFCLSYPTLLQLHSEGLANFDVAAFAARRLVRILPPYWLAIGLIFLLDPQMRVSLIDVVRQGLFLDRSTALVNSSFWTLPIEFRWYFAFPVLLWLWVRSPRAFGLLGVLCVVSWGTGADSADLELLPAFMLGIVAADMRARELPLAPWLVVVGIVAAIWGAAGTRNDFSNMPHEGWQIAAFAFVVCAGAVPWLQRVLSVRPLAAIGTASYSIYLVNLPVIFALRQFNPWLTALAGILVGGAFWVLCERPFVYTRLRERLLKELDFLPRWLRFAGLPVRVRMRYAGTADVFSLPIVIPQVAAQEERLAAE